ncbi:hypothetical protein FTUN_0783 [Frigoriglobus tundricola]|uniref:Uncharacterized protein n=1 Tax=Frigoriglobus tundricola TaxID=2774151 RepID=A0A6M5YGW6_9BACT|nr:hypothetical protein FTUN_0783 [Frigoriglobus tundricola]
MSGLGSGTYIIPRREEIWNGERRAERVGTAGPNRPDVRTRGTPAHQNGTAQPPLITFGPRANRVTELARAGKHG